MNQTPLPRLMLGDNQFFGINHMSEERARAQLMQFQRLDAVMQVVADAYDLGITTFMCTTHDRVAEICQVVRAEPERFARLQFQPGMPYAHKYANSVTEVGILGTLRRFIPADGAVSAALRGTRSVASKDIQGIATLLIDAEMAMFRGLPTPVIWMQNVVVDLLVGLGMVDTLAMFAEHVQRRYDAQPGFITMSLTDTLDALDRAGIANPLICTNINKLGFRMSGGIEGYQRALATRPFRAVAMSVFASGAIPPREAIEWVCQQPTIESIVFGASRRAHLASTKALVDEYWSGGAGDGPSASRSVAHVTTPHRDYLPLS